MASGEGGDGGVSVGSAGAGEIVGIETLSTGVAVSGPVVDPGRDPCRGEHPTKVNTAQKTSMVTRLIILCSYLMDTSFSLEKGTSFMPRGERKMQLW